MTRRKSIRTICIILIAVFLIVVLLWMCLKKGLYSEDRFSRMKPKVKICFAGNSIIADPDDSFRIDGSTLTILKGGKYRLTGDLDNGQIIVNADAEDKVVLKLNNVKVHCEDAAALWVQSADQVTLDLSEGTENYFSDGVNYREFPDGIKLPTGCIYSRCEMKIKGEGSLILLANHKDGLVCVDDLSIKSGNISIRSQNSAIKCKDCFYMEKGSLDLTAGKDGIHCEEIADLESGYLRIDAYRYGIYAYLKIKKTDDLILDIVRAKSGMASHMDGSDQGSE